VRFRVNIPATTGAAFANIAIGVKVELRHEAAIARRLDLWWLGGTPADRRYGFEIVFENAELLQALGRGGDGWTLTVTGSPEIAHRAGPAAQYWSGSIDVSLEVVQQGGTAPQRPWWTQQQVEEEAQGLESQGDE
jgi:hypothetical protein